MSEQVRLPMMASTKKNRGSKVALELGRFDLSCGGVDVMKVQLCVRGSVKNGASVKEVMFWSATVKMSSKC